MKWQTTIWLFDIIMVTQSAFFLPSVFIYIKNSFEIVKLWILKHGRDKNKLTIMT